MSDTKTNPNLELKLQYELLVTTSEAMGQRITEIQTNVIPEFNKIIAGYAKENRLEFMNCAVGLPNDNETLVIEFGDFSNLSESEIDSLLAKVNKLLLDNGSNCYLFGIEQVGIVYWKDGELITRMIGGEMCGNGSQILGEYTRNILNPENTGMRFIMMVDSKSRTFISSVDKNGRNILGVPGLVKEVISLSTNLWKVLLDGISYIVEVKYEKFLSEISEDRKLALISEAEVILSQNNIITAGGKIDLYIDPETGGFGIIPTLIIPGFSKMVERGCFTGTCAATQILTEIGIANKGEPISVQQRSGNIYTAYVPKNNDIFVMANNPTIIRGL